MSALSPVFCSRTCFKDGDPLRKLVILLGCFPGIVAAGQNPAVPDWLKPYPSTDKTGDRSSGAPAYIALAPPDAVIEHYKRELRTAAVTFSVESFGAGTAIRAEYRATSCAVRVTQFDDYSPAKSRVTVNCAVDESYAEPAVAAASPAETDAKNHAKPVEEWPQARWCMAEWEIIDAFQGKAKRLTGEPSGRQFGERIATVGIDRMDVGGITLRALFLFDRTGRLDRIHLSLPDSIRATNRQFGQLEAYLTRKYGEPARARSVNRGRFASVWLRPGTAIRLDYIPPISLTLRFDKPSGETTESLTRGLLAVHGPHVLPESAAAARASAMRVAVEQHLPQPPAGSGKWHVSETKSEFDDSRTVVLSLDAENAVSGWIATATPKLVLRCKEGKTEAYVVTGMPATVETGELQRHTVRIRYDDNAAATVLMAQSTDNKALFFPSPISSIRHMLGSRMLIVGFTPFNANPVTARFVVEGLEAAVKPLRASCRW